MADHPEPNTPVQNPAPAVTPSSNQNLIIGIVMGAVVLLLLLLVISQQSGGFNLGKKDDNQDLREKLEDAKKASEAERMASRGILSTQEGNLLASNIKRDAESLLTYINATQGELSRLRGSEAAQTELYTTIGNLKSQLSQAQNAQGQLVGLQSQLQNAQNRIQQLTEQLGNSVDQSTVARLREQVNGIKQEREELRTQLAELKASMTGMVDRTQLDELRGLIPENRRLRAELQELRTKLDSSKLFVTRDNLSPRAAKLFSELVRLEGNNENAIQQAYTRLEQDLKARVMERATFKTNSSILDTEHESHIENVITASPEGAFFLVVGYASKSGDVQSNRELSRKRATRTASVVNYLKRKGHEVQAVYLGETDRFGPNNARNQVCEVWEIKP